MASEGGGFLIEAATYLGAAAVAVPIFNRLKLGSILGYLTAGVVIGPVRIKPPLPGGGRFPYRRTWRGALPFPDRTGAVVS